MFLSHLGLPWWIPQIRWLQHLFLSVLNVGESKIKVLADSGSGESSLPELQRSMFFTVSSHGTEWRGEEESSPVSSYKALIPFMKVLLSQPNPPPKALYPDTTTSEVRISANEFEENITIQRIEKYFKIWISPIILPKEFHFTRNRELPPNAQFNHQDPRHLMEHG